MKISVLTPSYNSVNYIEKAIKSVLDQDYENFEHIIIDGGSKDGTIEILKKYPHLKWISEKDYGQSDAMNKAFRLSTGEIIVYLNADDFFEKNIFKEVVNNFISFKSEVIVGDLYIKYSDVNQAGRLVSPSHKLRQILFPNYFAFPYNPVSYFYKRNVQEAIKGFPLEEHYVMDYWFLLRAFAGFKTKKMDIPFGTFYISGTNKTSVHDESRKLKQLANDFSRSRGNSYYLWFKMLSVYYAIWFSIRHNLWWKTPIKRLISYVSRKRLKDNFSLIYILLIGVIFNTTWVKIFWI